MVGIGFLELLILMAVLGIFAGGIGWLVMLLLYLAKK